jgi:hypothetical protein
MPIPIDAKIPVQNEDYLVEPFEDEVLLYTVTGAKAVYMNQTAYLVWQLCGATATVAEIITCLEDSYPEQKEMIREDVHGALQTLIEAGAITLVDRPAS